MANRFFGENDCLEAYIDQTSGYLKDIEVGVCCGVAEYLVI